MYTRPKKSAGEIGPNASGRSSQIAVMGHETSTMLVTTGDDDQSWQASADYHWRRRKRCTQLVTATGNLQQRGTDENHETLLKLMIRMEAKASTILQPPRHHYADPRRTAL